VIADFSSDGKMKPLKLIWEDGRGLRYRPHKSVWISAPAFVQAALESAMSADFGTAG
jgi:hypothetical protein